MNKSLGYKKGDKYYSTMSIAYNAGYIIPYNNGKLCKATAIADYNYVATIFSRILNVPKSTVIGKHKSGNNMTMEEFEAYVSEVMPKVITKNTSKKTFQGNVIVNKPNVTLSNVTVKGNLVIGDGVADKEVTLDNVKVTGKLVVRGGGENSVIIKGNSNISTMEIKQINNAVSIKVSGDASVQLVYINDGSNDVILKGSFGSVNVKGSDINVTANDAAINDVTLTGANTSLNVTAGSTVSNVTLADTAKNAAVEVAGEVNNISSHSLNSAITVKDTGKVALIKASEAAVGIKIDVAAGGSVTSVESNAPGTVVSGEGKVENAAINGDNSKITTPNTKDTAGESSINGQNSTSGDNTTGTTPGSATGSTETSGTGSSSPSEPTPQPPTKPEVTPTEPETTTEPTEDSYYKTDEHFETGYPQMKLGRQEGSSVNVTISLKLKDGVASKASPATVYYIASSHNTAWDVSSDSVMHGHLGKTETTGYDTHPLVYTNYDGAVKITDSSVVDIPLSFSGNNQDLVVYFVAKTDSYISEVPTKILFKGETIDSFVDNSAPYALNAYWSNEQDASEGMKQRVVRVFVSEKIAPESVSSVASGSALTVTGVSNASITYIDTDIALDYYNYIDFTLTYPYGADLSNLTIVYNPTDNSAFTDVANEPYKMGAFTLCRAASKDSYVGRYIMIKDPEPKITQAYVSDDGKNLAVDVEPAIATDLYNCEIYINGVVWTEIGRIYSTDKCKFELYNDAADQMESSYTIEIKYKEGSSKIVDAVGQEYELITETVNDPVVSTITATSAILDLSDKQLNLTYSGDCSNIYDCSYGCQYVMTIDGVEYRLRGYLASEGTKDGGKVMFTANNLFDLDFEKITTGSSVKISLSPLGSSTISGIKEASGKMVDSFTIDVAVVE